MQEEHVEIAYNGDKETVIDLDDGRRLRIGLYHDDDPGSPRDWDNMGTMVCWHRRYNLGDEQPGGEPQDWLKSLALSLDDTLEDRLWHWHSGPGWRMLDNKADAEAARLLRVAKSREAEADALQEATNTLREKATGLLADVGESTFTMEGDYDLSERELSELATEVMEQTSEARILADRAANIEQAMTTMRREASQAREVARKQSDWAAINAANEREEEAIDKVLDEQIAVMLPLYLYDHGGITMRAAPFSCQWDSGQVGWTFVSKADVRREYSVTRISHKTRDNAEACLRAEVEVYAQYLEGRVYGFRWEVEESETCECCETTTWTTIDEESVWGYYGSPMDYMIPDEINPQLEQYGVQISN